jgi:hypothetical protein
VVTRRLEEKVGRLGHLDLRLARAGEGAYLNLRVCSWVAARDGNRELACRLPREIVAESLKDGGPNKRFALLSGILEDHIAAGSSKIILPRGSL